MWTQCRFPHCANHFWASSRLWVCLSPTAVEGRWMETIPPGILGGEFAWAKRWKLERIPQPAEPCHSSSGLVEAERYSASKYNTCTTTGRPRRSSNYTGGSWQNVRNAPLFCPFSVSVSNVKRSCRICVPSVPGQGGSLLSRVERLSPYWGRPSAALQYCSLPSPLSTTLTFIIMKSWTCHFRHSP